MLNIRHPHLVAHPRSVYTADTTTESQLETNLITTRIFLTGGLDGSGFAYSPGLELESRRYSWLDDVPLTGVGIDTDE